MKTTIIKSLLVVFFFLLNTNLIFASDVASSIPTSGNKFFVVVSILFTILIGIFLLLIYVERRLNKLEKNVQNS